MSDAIESARAVAAIPATLTERMFFALRSVDYLHVPAMRRVAYFRAGIRVDDYDDKEFKAADGEAFSWEMSRRFG